MVPVGDQVAFLVVCPLVIVSPALLIPAPSLRELSGVSRVTLGFRDEPTTGVASPAPAAGVAIPSCCAAEPPMVMLSGAPLIVRPWPVIEAVIPPTPAWLMRLTTSPTLAAPERSTDLVTT